MLKKLRKPLIIASLMFALVPGVAAPAVVRAADQIGDCLGQGSDLTIGDTNNPCSRGDTSVGTQRIQDIVTFIINIFSVIVGIVAVIMIIWGGFKYITSGGDSGNITSAKNTIIYAIIGLIIVALAQFLVKFVLDKVIQD